VRAPEVRILGGRWKGRRLEAGAAARPTASRARQALFNILGERIAGARVLDLYAGSGAVGIEALSRGAASAVLVETDAAPLRRSLERIGADPAQARVVEATVRAVIGDLVGSGERFGLVFADPPYALATEGDALSGAGQLLAEEGILVLQQDADLVPPQLPGLRLVDRREYGRNVFLFFGMR
jgi:16S rRNA (guanine966-N2)-methyltransferase